MSSAAETIQEEAELPSASEFKTQALPAEVQEQLPRVQTRLGPRVSIEALVPEWSGVTDSRTWLKEQKELRTKATSRALVAAILEARGYDRMHLTYRCVSCHKERSVDSEPLRTYTEADTLLVPGPWVPLAVESICPYCQNDLLWKYGNWRVKQFDEPNPLQQFTSVIDEDGEDELPASALLIAIGAAEDLDDSGDLVEKVVEAFKPYLPEGALPEDPEEGDEGPAARETVAGKLTQPAVVAA